MSWPIVDYNHFCRPRDGVQNGLVAQMLSVSLVDRQGLTRKRKFQRCYEDTGLCSKTTAKIHDFFQDSVNIKDLGKYHVMNETGEFSDFFGLNPPGLGLHVHVDFFGFYHYFASRLRKIK